MRERSDARNDLTEHLAEHPDAIIFPDERLEYDDHGRRIVPWPLAREVFYPDCEEALAREAHARLVPIATTGFTERCPIDVWPDVPATYILGVDDLVVGPRWSREVSMVRLGGPAIELPGGHSRSPPDPSNSRRRSTALPRSADAARDDAVLRVGGRLVHKAGRT